jgi:hypothetical protein
MYISVGDSAENRVGVVTEPGRGWPLPITESGRPRGGLAGTAGRTCQDVLDEAATCHDLMTMYATCLGVLTGIQGA